MNPLADTVAAAGSIPPSPVAAIVRLVAAMLLIGFCAWVLLRFRNRKGSDSTRIRVLDRALLNRGTGLTLVSVEGRRLLLGTSGDRVTLLTALDPCPAADGERPFHDVLAETAQTESRGEEAAQP